jgi:hypothetical protein
MPDGARLQREAVGKDIADRSRREPEPVMGRLASCFPNEHGVRPNSLWMQARSITIDISLYAADRAS